MSHYPTINSGVATTGTLTANSVNGAYNVAASASGAASINFALTNACARPVINMPPQSATVCPGAPVTFSVAAMGTDLMYQWRKGGNSIGGATGSSFTINSLVLGDAGSYDVAVSGACGTQTAAAATLLVNCPGLTVNPATLPNAPVGASYNQTLSATGGSAPYTFSVAGGALPGGLTRSSQG